MQRQTPSSRDKGFTLIELLIVVAIIGILAAIAIPNLVTALDKSRQVSSAALIKSYGTAVELYRIDNSLYPVASSIRVLTPMLLPFSESLKPYDEWKYDLLYKMTEPVYSIECTGKDGIDGPDISPETRYIFTLDIVFSNGNYTAGVE